MAKTDRTPVLAPQIDTIHHGRLSAGTPDLLVANADLDGVAFSDIDTPLLALADASIHGCRFTGVSVHEADWRSMRLHETTFDRLNVPIMRAHRSVWRNVHITGARLGSVEAYETSWHSVHFVGCKLSFMNLRGADLLDVAFTDCVVEELDLVQATARRVSIRGSRISRLGLQHATLENVDLRGDLDEIHGLDGLRGATMSSMQLSVLAPLLAREKGITVEDV